MSEGIKATKRATPPLGGFQQLGINQALRQGYIKQRDAQEIAQQINRVTNTLQQNITAINQTPLHNHHCQCEGCAGTKGCCGSFNKQEILAYINATNQNPAIFFSQNPKDLEIRQELLKRERERIYKQVEQQSQKIETEIINNFLGLQNTKLADSSSNYREKSQEQEILTNRPVELATKEEIQNPKAINRKIVNSQLDNKELRYNLFNNEVIKKDFEPHIPQIKIEKEKAKNKIDLKNLEKNKKLDLITLKTHFANSTTENKNYKTTSSQQAKFVQTYYTIIKAIKEIREILKTREINYKLKNKIESILSKIEKLSQNIENKKLQKIIKNTIEKLKEELKRKLENLQTQKKKEKVESKNRVEQKFEIKLTKKELEKIKKVINNILKQEQQLNKNLNKKLRYQTLLKLFILQYYQIKKQKGGKNKKILQKILEKLGFKKVEN
ncbi:MAG: hypothetical protein QXG16_04445 [Candidatus Anstonellaceae archaeon]